MDLLSTCGTKRLLILDESKDLPPRVRQPNEKKRRKTTLQLAIEDYTNFSSMATLLRTANQNMQVKADIAEIEMDRLILERKKEKQCLNDISRLGKSAVHHFSHHALWNQLSEHLHLPAVDNGSNDKYSSRDVLFIDDHYRSRKTATSNKSLSGVYDGQVFGIICSVVFGGQGFSTSKSSFTSKLSVLILDYTYCCPANLALRKGKNTQASFCCISTCINCWQVLPFCDDPDSVVQSDCDSARICFNCRPLCLKTKESSSLPTSLLHHPDQIGYSMYDCIFCRDRYSTICCGAVTRGGSILELDLDNRQDPYRFYVCNGCINDQFDEAKEMWPREAAVDEFQIMDTAFKHHEKDILIFRIAAYMEYIPLGHPERDNAPAIRIRARKRHFGNWKLQYYGCYAHERPFETHKILLTRANYYY